MYVVYSLFHFLMSLIKLQFNFSLLNFNCSQIHVPSTFLYVWLLNLFIKPKCAVDLFLLVEPTKLCLRGLLRRFLILHTRLVYLSCPVLILG